MALSGAALAKGIDGTVVTYPGPFGGRPREGKVGHTPKGDVYVEIGGKKWLPWGAKDMFGSPKGAQLPNGAPVDPDVALGKKPAAAFDASQVNYGFGDGTLLETTAVTTWAALKTCASLVDEVVETADDARIAFHQQAYAQAFVLATLAAAGGVLILAPK